MSGNKVAFSKNSSLPHFFRLNKFHQIFTEKCLKIWRVLSIPPTRFTVSANSQLLQHLITKVFLQLLNKFVEKVPRVGKTFEKLQIFCLRLLLIETVFKSLTAPTFKEIARQVSSRLGDEGNESFAKTAKEICFLFLQRLTEAMLFCVKLLFPLPLQFAKVPFVRLYVSFLHRDAKIK